MKRYFTIAWHFFQASVMTELEYRFETISWGIGSLLWMLVLFIGVELIFGQTSFVAGWSKQQVLLIAATEAIFAGSAWLIFLQGIMQFLRWVPRGELDPYLFKPINTRFLISTNSFNLENIPRITVALIVLFSIIRSSGNSVTVFALVGYFLLIFLGLFIFYNLFFLIATSIFWLQEIFNLEDLFDNLLDMGKYPVYIFEGGLRFLFVYVVPVAFIATFPVQVLLGQKGIETIILAAFMAVVSFVLSQRFWNHALKRYSSASS